MWLCIARDACSRTAARRCHGCKNFSALIQVISIELYCQVNQVMGADEKCGRESCWPGLAGQWSVE